MIRTFVAVELETSLRQAIGRMQEQLKDRLQAELREMPRARLQWVRPESIHLTLKFLGDVEETRIDGMCRALGDAIGALPPFAVGIQGVGVFPDVRAPRVLWLGVSSRSGPPSESDPLSRLAGDVDQALHRLGFPLETRSFSPHLTLARIKERPHEIGKALSECQVIQTSISLGTLAVRAVALMKSDLTPSGSRYTRLCDIQLAESMTAE